RAGSEIIASRTLSWRRSVISMKNTQRGLTPALNLAKDRHVVQAPRALFTARMTNAMFAAAPFGMPCGHADGAALPKTMLTSVMRSLIATAWRPAQSPTHTAAGEGVGVGVGAAATRMNVNVPPRPAHGPALML